MIPEWVREANSKAKFHKDLWWPEFRNKKTEWIKYAPNCEARLKRVGPRTWYCDACKVQLSIGRRKEKGDSIYKVEHETK